ncbi:MAG: hypothetical protein MZV64_26535 [Ignavibacteriales bacterium]|nr:hypothetical protein [Ignavibacteriales bacterium]
MRMKMIIFELFSKTYQLVKDNLILVQPLLIFLLILGFIMSPVSAGGINFIILLPLIGLYWLLGRAGIT